MVKDTKQLFFFSDLKLVTENTNNLPIKRPTPLLVSFFTQPVILIMENDDNEPLFLSPSDNYLPLVRQSIRIRHTTNRYWVVAQHLAFSTVAQNEICELLSYNIAIRSLEAYLWKQAIDEEVSSLFENHTRDLVNLQVNTIILKKK